MATTRVGINGFGRIGRNFFRAYLQRGGDLEIVAANDIGDTKTMAHLLKHDSVLGTLDLPVEAGDGFDSGRRPRDQVRLGEDPAQLPWGELEIDIAIESTGLFTDRESAQKHLDAGAKKVVISAPATDPDVTIVLGVNDRDYDPEQHNIVSNASCTTNCVAPLAKILHEAYTIERGFMTTIHAYTNDQRTLDLPHPDLRRARAAAINLIPTSTGAARAIGLVLPDLKGKVDGMSMRAPVPTGSIVDLVVEVGATTSKDEVNELFRSKADTGDLEGILQYSDEPLVSTDIVHSSYSCDLRQRPDDGEREPREGLRLVRQRVGLQLPARRSRREDREDHAGGRRRIMRAPALGPRRRCRGQDDPRPLRPERAARERRSRRRHAHPRVAADAAPAARGGAREVRVCSHLGRPKTEEDRAKYAMAPVERRLRELLPDERLTRAREHALRPWRDEERRDVRARARDGVRSLRERRVRVGAPRARFDGGRGAPAARVRRASAARGARASGEAARRGRAAFRARSRAGRRWTTSSACSKSRRSSGHRSDRREDGRAAARRESARLRGGAADRRRRRRRVRGGRGVGHVPVRRPAGGLARPRHRARDARAIRARDRRSAHDLLERPDGRLRVAARSPAGRKRSQRPSPRTSRRLRSSAARTPCAR